MASKKLQDLQFEFDGLLKGVKRKEQLKGSKSKFYPVFKARGMKPLKTGGPVVKAKFGTSGLLAGMAGIGSGAKAMAKKPKRKIIKKKSKKKPFDPAERSAKDAYIIGGTGIAGIGGAATLGHKDAVKKSKQKKEGRSRNIGGKDVSKMPIKKKANGSLVGGQKKLDVNRDGKITGSDFKMLKMNKKKYGGKINYRMKGGQVVDAGYD